MKYAVVFGFCSFLFALSGCGGQPETAKNADTTGGSTDSNGGLSAVGGSTANIDRTCAVPNDCVVQSFACCHGCGIPNASDYTAMNRYAAYDYQRAVCPIKATCITCNAQVGINVLQATCEQGQCALVDLRQSDVTACSTASDCYVRAPECCECGGTTNEFAIIAVSSTATVSYASLVCGPSQACPDCAPQYPAVTVDCVSGHCQIVN